MVNSQFCTDPELTGFINASYYELYDLLVQKFGNEYFVALDTTGKPYQFTTTTAEMYPLPDGTSTYKMPDTTTNAPAFFKALGVDVQIDSLTWASIHRFGFAERNSGDYPVITPGRSDLRYRLNGSNIWLRSGRSSPAAGLLIRVWYVPRLTALSLDADVLDGVSGWEEYIVVDAARKALEKEESDATHLERAKAALVQRIEAAAENRDAGSPATVSDVRGDEENDGWRY